MRKRSRDDPGQAELWEKLIGLGEYSIRKSYYPELQRQLEKLQERVELAELVAEVGQGLTEEQDLHSSLQRCSDALTRRTAAALVRIWVADHADRTLTLQASSGLHTRIDGAHSRLSINDYPYKIGVIARERKPLLCNDVVGNPLFHDQAWVARHGIVAFAGYPLLLQQRLVGIIALFAQQALEKTTLETLAAIANQVAVGIERIQALNAYKAALAQARASHDKVDGILRSVADALLVIDDDRRILHMNQAAEALLGVPLAAAGQQRIDQVIREQALLDYLNSIDLLADVRDEIDLSMFDVSLNQQRIIQARTARLTGTWPRAGLVVSLRDVTADREMARLKTEFISTAAHELRTPLATIMGFSELLFAKKCDRATQLDYLTHIIEKADALNNIIDDLLDLSRIESGRGLALNCSEWNLDSTLERLIGRCQTEYRNYQFELVRAEPLGMIHADHGKILQVLDNLLGNALKYSPPGTAIRLAALRVHDTLTISVTDQGIGMTDEQVAHCFEKFYRADRSDTARGGLGLGLSIVRHVIESHGGQVEVKSAPGEGTTVTFTLPMLG